MTQYKKSFIFLLIMFLQLTSPSHAVDDLYSQADSLNQNGQKQEAMALLQKEIKANPSRWQAYLLMGQILSQTGATKEAFWYLSKAYGLAPGQISIWISVADWYCDNHDYKNATSTFENCVKYFPHSSKLSYIYTKLAMIATNQHDATQCQKYWQQVIALKPYDADLWLQAAQSCDKYNFKKEAIYFYRQYIDLFDRGDESETAKNRLKKLVYESERDEVKDLAKQDLNYNSKLNSFVIKFHDSQVSENTLEIIKFGLNSIPESYRRQLINAGYKVVVGDTIDQILPEIADEHPRGWCAGATWHNSHGTFYLPNKWIVVAEKYRSIFDNEIVIDNEIDKTICHEFGHAYDHYLGGLTAQTELSETEAPYSHSKKFSDAYAEDLKQIPDEDKEKLAYFLQPDDAGKEELFAEMFPLLYIGRIQPNSPEELFSTCFPTVLKMMSGKLKI